MIEEKSFETLSGKHLPDNKKEREVPSSFAFVVAFYTDNRLW